MSYLSYCLVYGVFNKHKKVNERLEGSLEVE
jgi:hypothetical protein